MSKNHNLKLINSYETKKTVLDISNLDQSKVHSLETIIDLPMECPSFLASNLISQFSTQGDVVLDPFCYSGSVVLSAALKARIPYFNDSRKSCLDITRSLIDPADLTEVTLFLQTHNLKTLSDIDDEYRNYFSPFFEINTYREIKNLRKFLVTKDDRVANYVKMLLASILHGPSASFLSTPTHSQYSVTPSQQLKLNADHNLVSEYRSVTPRIIKRSASGMIDGYNKSLEDAFYKSKFSNNNPLKLASFDSSIADLVVSTFPVYEHKSFYKDQWLKNWIYGEDQYNLNFDDKESYLNFVDEYLLEVLRVTKNGSRICFYLPSLNEDYVSIIKSSIKKKYSKFAFIEEILSSPVQKNALGQLKNNQNKWNLIVIRKI